MIRVGMVDFDTSHVEAFTQRFHHIDTPESEWVNGVRVVAGCPGDSEIMPERIPGYLEKLRGYGVEIVDRPEDLLGKIDAVMIESQQGRRHLERARPFLEAGLPTFVDKPFAETLEDAEAMISLAEQHGAPLLSCSALRYDPKVTEALERQKDLGRILSADVWGAAALHSGNPGLLHYGIHGVEMLYTLMGAGCQSVRMMSEEAGEVALGHWDSGFIGSLRGIRAGQYGFGFVAHYEKGHVPYIIEGAAFYRELLKVFVTMCETGVPPLDYAVLREIMAFIRAADLSRDRGGSLETV